MERKIDLNNVEIAFQYKSNRELRKTVFIFKLIQYPFLVKVLSKTAEWILKLRLPFQFILKSTVFNVFCAGQNREEAQDTMNRLKIHGVNTVLDYVAEGDNSEESFANNLETICENIRFVSIENSEPFVGVKLSGLEDVEFIQEMKISELSEGAFVNLRWDKFVDRVDQICLLAASNNVKVYFDAEEINTQDAYDYVVEQMMEKYNLKTTLIYNTLQMYRKDRLAYLERIINHAKSKGFLIGLKLVRGAYFEKERDLAHLSARVSPVYDTKDETDNAFNQAVNMCLENHAIVSTCLATHNQKSVELALNWIEEFGIEDHYNKVFFSQLFGMSDNLTFNLAEGHFNSSKYVPYGEVKKAIPYLLRRAEENSSIEGQASREYELLVKEKSRRNI